MWAFIRHPVFLALRETQPTRPTGATPFPAMRLSGIFLYPVKSLRGYSASSVKVDAIGPVGDRRFLVVDGEGRFLTQRSLPRMALITTALSPETLTLSTERTGAITVARTPVSGSPTRRVSVWKSEGLLAHDCGDLASEWLGECLQTKCRLVQIGADYARPILKPGIARNGEGVTFADAFPFLLVGEASFDNLNDRLVTRGEEALPMNRFRPNLVVTGCAPFAEDTWNRFRIGDVVFRTAGPCARCTVTTTDQITAERGQEPLRTLATFRRDAQDPTDVNFGQNLIHESKTGVLHVGDIVELLD